MLMVWLKLLVSWVLVVGWMKMKVLLVWVVLVKLVFSVSEVVSWMVS